MDKISYIQASDLQLDAPFRDLDSEVVNEGQLKNLLRKATFSALDNLVLACASSNPDFLILSGKICDSRQTGMRPLFILKEACARLDQLGIPVLISNSDPENIFHTRSIAWPQNTRFLSMAPYQVEKNGECAAIICNIPMTDGKLNFSGMFPSLAKDAPAIGVICFAEDSSFEEPYKPLDNLPSRPDAWIWCNISRPEILCQAPFIACSGAIQGLSAQETGARGCYLVTAKKNDGHWLFYPDFFNLAPIQWEKIIIDLQNLDNMTDLEHRINSRLCEIRDSMKTPVTAIIASIVLDGKTDLARQLRNPERRHEFRRKFRRLASGPLPVWVNDLELASEDSHADLLSKNDLSGELARQAKLLLENSEEICFRLGVAPNPAENIVRKEFFTQHPAESLHNAMRLCQNALEEC